MLVKHLTILLSLFIFSCAGQQAASNISHINFGGGGGFTGAVRTFQLTADGQLSDVSGEPVALKKIEDTKVASIFAAAEKINFTPINTPGNMYQFIKLEFTDRETISWTWGGPNNPVPEAVTALYDQLMALTK